MLISSVLYSPSGMYSVANAEEDTRIACAFDKSKVCLTYYIIISRKIPPKKYEALFKALEIVEDFNSPSEVLHQKLFVDLRKSIPHLYDYIDAFFRFNSSSSNTLVSCLVDEMEALRDFHSKNHVLALKDKYVLM